MRALRHLFVPILLAALTAPALAQEPEFVAKHDDWTAYTTTESGRKVCFMSSPPTKSQGDYTDRGDVLAFVSIYKPTPQGDAYYPGGQVSIVAGYNYQKDSSVEVDIDGTKFTMFTQGDTAWATGADVDKRLIAAMKAGVTMTVNGTSWRPTDTTDRFSLRGFTATYSAISAACK